MIDHTTAESNMIRMARLRERLAEADENAKRAPTLDRQRSLEAVNCRRT